MSKARRLFLIMLVVLIPLALMHSTLLHIVTQCTLPRFLGRVSSLLSAPGFGLWTVWLGLIIYSCVYWFKKPTVSKFILMLLTCVILGSAFICFLRMVFFFSMPGDGPIP